MVHDDQIDLEQEDEYLNESPGLLRDREPFLGLISAIFSQAIEDARVEHTPSRRSKEVGCSNQDARDFLMDGERVAYLCELAGCDHRKVHPALLRAAGLPLDDRIGKQVA